MLLDDALCSLRTKTHSSLTQYPVLATQRLILWHSCPADHDFLAELRSDPRTMWFTPTYPDSGPITNRKTMCTCQCESLTHSSFFGWWTICLNSSATPQSARTKNIARQTPIGVINISQPRHRREDTAATLSYLFKPQFWGQGYATEAAIALIDKLFSAHSVEYISASTMMSNHRSVRVLEKLGMKKINSALCDADLLTHNTHSGAVEYLLSHADWQNCPYVNSAS